MPDHSQARAALPDRRQDAPDPQGAGRADEALLHPPKRAIRQAVRRIRERGVLRQQLLGVLAVDVRHRALARRPGDEALHATLRPAFRWDGGSQHHQVHTPQPVRLSGPPASQVARAARRHDCVRHEGHQRRVRHHPGTQGRSPDRVDPGRKARRTRRHQERLRPHHQWLCGRKHLLGGPPHPGQVELGTSRRVASGRCGATSPPRTPPSVNPDKFCAHTEETSLYFGMHQNPRRQDSAVHRADLQARLVQSRGEAHHRRPGDHTRFQLAVFVQRRAQSALQGPRRRAS